MIRLRTILSQKITLKSWDELGRYCGPSSVFERSEIRKAAIRCAKATKLHDDESEYLIFAVTNSPMMGAAVQGGLQ